MLTLHIFSVLFSGGVIIAADKEAMGWFRGRTLTMNRSRVRIYHYLMWVGLGAVIVSGFFLFYPMWQFLVTNQLFIIKMLFVAILIINGILVGRLQDIALTRPYASLTLDEKLPLFASAAISVFSWLSAGILAFAFL